MEQLFWNRSISRVGLLYGGIAPDAFRADSFRVTERGRLVHSGRALRGSFLFDDFALQPQFTGATQIGRSGQYRLFRADGTPRLSPMTFGLYHDGWLARGGQIRAGPTPGTVSAARSASISRFRRTSAPNRPLFGCAPPACAGPSWALGPCPARLVPVRRLRAPAPVHGRHADRPLGRVPPLPRRRHAAALAHDLGLTTTAGSHAAARSASGPMPGTASAARSASTSPSRRTSAPNRPPFGCAPAACAGLCWSGRAGPRASRSR